MRDTNRSLDALRGIAAVLVVLGHARNFFLQAAGAPVRGDSALQTLFLIPTSFGEEAVAVFFVLSGFLVGGQVVRQVRGDRFEWREFMVKRLSRLWTVLLPGIFLTALLDSLGSILSDNPTAARWFSPVPSVTEGLCNVAFLQQGRCDDFGSNSALWSLSYEFWFYIIFAGAAFAVGSFRMRRLPQTIVGVAIVAGSIAAFGVHVLWFMPAWLVGVVVAVAVERHSRWAIDRATGWRIGSALVLLAAAMLASNVLGLEHGPKFAFVGVAAAPLVFLLASVNPEPARRAQLFRFAAWIGTWSFSLYVFHTPVVKVLSVLVADTVELSSGPLVVAVYVLTIVVAAATYPMWAVTERWTTRIRDAALRSVAPSRVVTPPRG